MNQKKNGQGCSAGALDQQQCVPELDPDDLAPSNNCVSIPTALSSHLPVPVPASPSRGLAAAARTLITCTEKTSSNTTLAIFTVVAIVVVAADQ